MDTLKFTVAFHDFAGQSLQQLIGLYGQPRTVVEIGCFEGYTTFNLTSLIAKTNPNYRHYAIDPHAASVDLPDAVPVRMFPLAVPDQCTSHCVESPVTVLPT